MDSITDVNLKFISINSNKKIQFEKYRKDHNDNYIEPYIEL